MAHGRASSRLACRAIRSSRTGKRMTGRDGHAAARYELARSRRHGRRRAAAVGQSPVLLTPQSAWLRTAVRIGQASPLRGNARMFGSSRRSHQRRHLLPDRVRAGAHRCRGAHPERPQAGVLSMFARALALLLADVARRHAPRPTPGRAGPRLGLHWAGSAAGRLRDWPLVLGSAYDIAWLSGVPPPAGAGYLLPRLAALGHVRRSRARSGGRVDHPRGASARCGGICTRIAASAATGWRR
jgi:hypothetical protein